MNIGEGNDVNVLLSFLVGRYQTQLGDDEPGPSGAEAREAAERLADRAHRALYAGWTGERLRAAMQGREAVKLLPGVSPSKAEAEMLAGFRGDPTHGRIDPDVRAAVDEMRPHSLAQRVAIENTLQARRHLREGR